MGDSSGASSSAEPEGRRTFLKYLAAAISSFITMILAVPVVGYLVGPILKPTLKGDWVNLGKLTGFADGPPRAVQFSLTRQDGWVEVKEARTCWVVPGGPEQLVVFNGRCPHLGCAFSWRAGADSEASFLCPCHSGVYDREGNVLDGPPPRPLDRLQTRVENGDLLVLYQDFRLGTGAKAPL